MNTAAAADLERYPAYKRLYLKAFEKMIKVRIERGLGVEGKWSTPEKVMKWWLELPDDYDLNVSERDKEIINRLDEIGTGEEPTMP